MEGVKMFLALPKRNSEVCSFDILVSGLGSEFFNTNTNAWTFDMV